MNTAQKITATLAITASLGAVGFALPQSSHAQAPLAPAVVRQMRAERHPELRRALATLVRTETELRKSARDFGGHREKAADLCHQAQGEIKLALQYDKS